MTDRLDPPPLAEPAPAADRRRRTAARLRRAAPFLAGIARLVPRHRPLRRPVPGQARHHAAPGRRHRRQRPRVADARPARSELVFNTIQPSLVLIEIDTKPDATPAPSASPATERPRQRRRRQPGRRDPHGPPRRRRRDPHPAHVRRRHAVDRATVVEPRPGERHRRPRRRTSCRRTLVPATLGNPAAMQHRQRGVHRRQPVRPVRLDSAGVVSGPRPLVHGARARDRRLHRPDPGRRRRQPRQLRRSAARPRRPRGRHRHRAHQPDRRGRVHRHRPRRAHRCRRRRRRRCRRY